MKRVKHMRLKNGLTVGALVSEMNECGVLGAGKIGKAAEIVKEMFSDSDYTVFLTLAGPLVPGGLRQIIRDLIEQEYVNVIVTTGANMVHDMVESLGHHHWIGTFLAEDEELKTQDIGRIGDIYIGQDAFKGLEKWMYKTLESIPETKRERISTTELLFEIGKRLPDSDSILATAAKKEVPIISPGLVDSIAGFHLWMFGQDKKLRIDPLLDTHKLVDIVYEAKKAGIIILGGGWPKHFTLFANTFREGVDRAIQITMDRPEPGGLSGATLKEAISWGKVKPEGKAVTVICDVTIAFPLIVASALEGLGKTH
ncbi:MAG: deoxyhypusine synthase [Candidatus Bathyarchaeota archaeon]|nr:deoxyhypusine synthase [Candidatus Bathyarchaeota archaeon]